MSSLAGQRENSICQVWRAIDSFHSRVLQVVIFLIISVALSGCNDSVRRQLMPMPKFLPGTKNITVREGDMAVLPCAIQNLGTKRVAWRRLNSEFFLTVGKTTWVKDANVLVEHEAQPGDITTWDLLIKNVKPNDSGIYECQITSIHQFAYHVQLNVVGPPITEPDLNIDLNHFQKNVIFDDTVTTLKDLRTVLPAISVVGSDYVDHGQRIKLVCNATGGPHIPEDIDWFKDGDKIDSHKYRNIIITKYRSLISQSMVSELLIDRSTNEDSGTYICRSSQDVINSIKVTVLIADTTNVKRGTGPEINSLNGAGVSVSCYAKPSLTLSFIVSILFFRCVL